MEDGRIVSLSDDRRADLSRRNDALAGQALRVLAIAMRNLPAASLGLDPQAIITTHAPDGELPESIEDDLVLLGLIGMIDPPRSETKAAVATAKRAHIRSVMITGDHPATAEAIARELDIFEPGTRLLTGADLRTMQAAEFDAIVEHVRVFARVDPEHKLRIVKALQRKGQHRRHDRRRHQRCPRTDKTQISASPWASPALMLSKEAARHGADG